MTYTAPQSSPAPSRLPVWAAVTALLVAAAPSLLVGQSRVSQSTSFRKDPAGTVVGAVGVSGDTSDNDEIAALAGLAAAGLTADTGA